MRTFIRTISILVIIMCASSWAQSKKYSVIINTIPHSAQVFVNGKKYTKTPCGFAAPANFNLNLEIRKAGYESWQRNYLVQDDINIDITLKSLTDRVPQKSEYPVGLITLPKGADVIVDGEVRGMTPWGAKFPAGARLDIVLSKPGYQDWRQTLVVNDEIKKKIKLQSQAISRSKKKYWLIPAIAVVGIGAYVLSSQSDDTPAGDPWPTPPSRPN